MLKIFQGNIMFGSSRKKLIAIGCSYTNYERHGTHWPEFLAEHLDMKVVNLGMPGRGNSYMFSILQDVLMLNKFTLSESKHFKRNLSAAAKPYQLHQLINSWPKRTEFNIKNEDIGLVVIMWSEFQRMDFESKRFWLSFHPHRNDWKYEKYPLEKAGRDVMVQWNNVFSATLLSMRYFHLSQLLLKDIPYIFVQGTKPTVTPTNAHDRDLIPERYVKRSSYDRDGLVSFERISSRAIINSNYFDLIDWLNEQNKRIFVDLKFFDVPATVGRAVSQLQGRGITFATVHGNDAMMRSAAEAADGVGILAVTVLTSLDKADMLDLGFDCDIPELVCSRARRAIASGCAGVVASGQEAQMLRETLGKNGVIVTPGIRSGAHDDDQKRAVTPRRALMDGSDYLVVGRPIRDAQSPRDAAVQIQNEIRSTLTEL